MSENTTTEQGSNGTVAQLDPELLEQLLALKKKEDERKQKLADAAAERKRANNRGKLPDGVTDRNATQAYLAGLGALLVNWVEMYEADPAQLTRRIREQLAPSIVAMSNTPSVAMATGQDTRRHDMAAWHAPHKVKAPAESK